MSCFTYEVATTYGSRYDRPATIDNVVVFENYQTYLYHKVAQFLYP